jgi:hypothetical protein
VTGESERLKTESGKIRPFENGKPTKSIKLITLSLLLPCPSLYLLKLASESSVGNPVYKLAIIYQIYEIRFKLINERFRLYQTKDVERRRQTV